MILGHAGISCPLTLDPAVAHDKAGSKWNGLRAIRDLEDLIWYSLQPWEFSILLCNWVTYTSCLARFRPDENVRTAGEYPIQTEVSVEIQIDVEIGSTLPHQLKTCNKFWTSGKRLAKFQKILLTSSRSLHSKPSILYREPQALLVTCLSAPVFILHLGLFNQT